MNKTLFFPLSSHIFHKGGNIFASFIEMFHLYAIKNAANGLCLM